MTAADAPPSVAAIRRQARGRVAVAASDGEQLILRAETVELAGLRVGAPLDDDARARIKAEEGRLAAHETALRLLAHRPRGERELAMRLRQRGFAAELAEAEVARLRRAGLLDDERFARAWVESRAPRGRRLLRHELLARGVAVDMADAATADVDDRETALELARRRAPRLAGLEFGQFRARLGRFLQRRGLSHEAIDEAVRAAWEETAARGDR